MTFQEFIKLCHRNWIFLIINIILVELIGLLIIFTVYKPGIQNSIFYSVSVQNQTASTSISPFENLQAADQFTDSILGWFKDPSLLSKFYQNGPQPSLKVIKQEKNNLQISFKTSDQQGGQTIYQQISNNLNQQINTYNKLSDFHFSVAVNNFLQSPQKNNYPLLIFIFFFLGLLLGIFSAYVYELGSDRVISASQLKSQFRRAKIFFHPGPDFNHHEEAILIKLGKTKINDIKLSSIDQDQLIFFIR